MIDENDEPILGDNKDFESEFMFELNYGENQPRLMYNRRKIIASMDNDMGQYDDPDQTMWTLVIDQQESVDFNDGQSVMTSSTRFLKSAYNANSKESAMGRSEKNRNAKQKDPGSQTIHQKIWQGMNL